MHSNLSSFSALFPRSSYDAAAAMPALAPVDSGNCELLGSVGLIVQALMGALVVATLLFKRAHEKPRRPWQIWVLDTSKQFMGQALVHTSNVLISTFPNAPSPAPASPSLLLGPPLPVPLPPNPCSLYFLNVLIDTTAGVVLIWALLRAARWLLIDKLCLTGWESGVYIPNHKALCWIKQATIYCSSLLVMKLVVLALFRLFPGLFSLGAWILSPLDRRAQVVVVMSIFPLVMNVLQFAILDTILKSTASASSSSTSSATPRASRRPSPIATSYAPLPSTSSRPPSPSPTSPDAISSARRLSHAGPTTPRPEMRRLRSASPSFASSRAEEERESARGGEGEALLRDGGGEEERRTGG